MAYELAGYKWGVPVYGRPSGTFTVGFDPSFFTELSDDFGPITGFEVAAASALETWAAVAAIDFAIVPAGTPADLTIAVGSLPGAAIGESLTTFFELSGVDEVISSVITLDADEFWSPFGQAGLNFFNVVLHEAGHSLGLDHPSGAGAAAQAMYDFYRSDTTISLGAGDIEGIRLIYGPANPEIFGSGGDDTIDRSGIAIGIGEAIYGLGGDDLVFGTEDDDLLSGGSGNDRLVGGAGADRIADMTGDGLLQGGTGHDRLFAGIGNSRLDGGPGADMLTGGTGNDALAGGGETDILRGDPEDTRVSGNDRLDGGGGNDLLMGGGGSDIFVFRAGGGADRVGVIVVDWLDPAATFVAGGDFTPGLDRIEFETGTFTSAAQVYAATETVGGSAVITFGSASMTIQGVTEAALTADSFLFDGPLA